MHYFKNWVRKTLLSDGNLANIINNFWNYRYSNDSSLYLFPFFLLLVRYAEILRHFHGVPPTSLIFHFNARGPRLWEKGLGRRRSASRHSVCIVSCLKVLLPSCLPSLVYSCFASLNLSLRPISSLFFCNCGFIYIYYTELKNYAKNLPSNSDGNIYKE